MCQGCKHHAESPELNGVCLYIVSFMWGVTQALSSCTVHNEVELSRQVGDRRPQKSVHTVGLFMWECDEKRGGWVEALRAKGIRARGSCFQRRKGMFQHQAHMCFCKYQNRIKVCSKSSLRKSLLFSWSIILLHVRTRAIGIKYLNWYWDQKWQ